MGIKNTEKKILFIINPISGTGRKKVIEELIINNIDVKQFYYEIKYTKARGDGIKLSKEAAEKNYFAVIAVGGDGSVNEAARGVYQSQTALGIIPAGSGNGFARHLKLPFNIEDALKIIQAGNIKQTDVIKLNEEIFLNIAGVGFDALVAKKYSKAGKRGFWSYFKIVTREYINYKPKKYFLDIDGKKITTRALLIAFANSSQFGYNTSIAPDASIYDGMVDVCIVQKIPILKTPFITNLLFLKKIDKTKYVDIIKAKNVTLKRIKNRVINLDGEAIRTRKQISVQVLPKSLNVLVP